MMMMRFYVALVIQKYLNATLRIEPPQGKFGAYLERMARLEGSGPPAVLEVARRGNGCASVTS
jgi:hypothetical protein